MLIVNVNCKGVENCSTAQLKSLVYKYNINEIM